MVVTAGWHQCTVHSTSSLLQPLVRIPRCTSFVCDRAYKPLMTLMKSYAHLAGKLSLTDAHFAQLTEDPCRAYGEILEGPDSTA